MQNQSIRVHETRATPDSPSGPVRLKVEVDSSIPFIRSTSSVSGLQGHVSPQLADGSKRRISATSGACRRRSRQVGVCTWRDHTAGTPWSGVEPTGHRDRGVAGVAVRADRAGGRAAAHLVAAVVIDRQPTLGPDRCLYALDARRRQGQLRQAPDRGDAATVHCRRSRGCRREPRT
jgi:hypothetical protein